MTLDKTRSMRVQLSACRNVLNIKFTEASESMRLYVFRVAQRLWILREVYTWSVNIIVDRVSCRFIISDMISFSSHSSGCKITVKHFLMTWIHLKGYTVQYTCLLNDLIQFHVKSIQHFSENHINSHLQHIQANFYSMIKHNAMHFS